MLRTRIKTRLITNAKQKTQNPKSQIEIDNGVHPLHWATSPGPSPMGTDPINGLKMVQNGSGINFSNCKQDVGQSLQDLSSVKLQLAFKRQRKLKYNRECQLPQKQPLLHRKTLLITETRCSVL